MRTIEIGIAGISENVLSVSVDYHHQASPLVNKWHAHRRVVDGICRDIEEAVADAVREPEAASAPDGAGEIPDRFRSLGLALFQELLKDECDRLRDFGTEADSKGDHPGTGDSFRAAAADHAGRPEDDGRTYLVFKIDKSLAYLPLELMHDGRASLAQRFAVGRVIYAESAGAREACPRRPPHTVLIIGDPSNDTGISRDVEDEIDALRDVLKQVGDYSPRIAVGDEADMKYILSNLPGTTVFHFSGHGVVSDDDEQTGLRLASEGILSGYSLQGLQNAPVFAFLNVCTPASRETWKGPLGIIETLLRRGTRACVSTLWEVRSKAATILASHFYAHLLRGQTFGEALRLARMATAAEVGLGDPTWAAYALYGDPRMRLVETASGSGTGLSRSARRRRQAAIFTALAIGGAVVVVGMLLGLPTRKAPGTLPESAGTAADQVTGESAAPAQGSLTEAQEVGYLVIESSPSGADILIDGRRIGVTPYAAEVAVGMHEVALEKQGYRRWEASVEVRVSPRANLTASLERIK